MTDVGLGALAGPHRCFGGISYFYFSGPNHPKATPNQDEIIHFYRNQNEYLFNAANYRSSQKRLAEVDLHANCKVLKLLVLSCSF